MNVGISWKANLKGSGSLPAPRSGHATTIMSFLLLYSSEKIWIATKFNKLFLYYPEPLQKFCYNPLISFLVILLTNKLTDRQTNAIKNTTYFAKEVFMTTGKHWKSCCLVIKDFCSYKSILGWQPTLCVVWYLIWWFANLEKYGHTCGTECPYCDQVSDLVICKFRKVWTYVALNVLTVTRCH